MVPDDNLYALQSYPSFDGWGNLIKNILQRQRRLKYSYKYYDHNTTKLWLNIG